jgi:hypothetical protein
MVANELIGDSFLKVPGPIYLDKLFKGAGADIFGYGYV